MFVCIRNVFCMRRLMANGIQYFPIFVAHAFYTSIPVGARRKVVCRGMTERLTPVLHENRHFRGKSSGALHFSTEREKISE